MDLAFTNGDIDITNGDLSFVEDAEADRQDIQITLSTWLRETPYDRAAGVPYLQVIFERGTTDQAVRSIIEQQLLARASVAEVIEILVTRDRATRVLTITGTVRRTNGDPLTFTTQVTE